MTLAVIALLALVVFINVSEVSAASTTTVDTNSVVKSSDTVKNYIESKKTVPTTLTVNNEQLAIKSKSFFQAVIPVRLGGLE